MDLDFFVICSAALLALGGIKVLISSFDDDDDDQSGGMGSPIYQKNLASAAT